MSTVKEKKMDLEKIGELREQILRLSALQNELHVLVSQKKPPHLSQGAFVAMIGKQRSSILRFLNQQQAVGRGKMLSELTTFAQRPDIESRIEKESLGISDKVLGISILSREAIVRAFKVFEAYERFNEPEMTQRLFVHAFPESYREIIEKTLSCSQDTIRKLSDGAIWAPLQELLQEESLVYLLEEVRRDSTVRTQEKSKECREIWERIRSRFEMFSQTAHAVGLGESTLRKIFRDSASEKTIDQILEKLKEAENRLAPKAAEIKQEKSDRVTHEDANASSSVSDERKTLPAPGHVRIKNLRDTAGVPSELDVPYTLGPDSMKSIVIETEELANQLCELLKKNIQLTRILFNTVVQITDQDTKRSIREDYELAHEVEELNLAIRTFSVQNPNSLLPLIQAQRHTFAFESQQSGQDKKRRK